MKARFWLLQGLGWLPYGLLQLLISTDDRPISSPEHIGSALALSGLAVSGSLLLRALYRRLHDGPFGELAWLGMVLAASVTVAVAVDAVYYGSLWLLSGTSTALASLYAAQPLFVRAPLIALMYLLWSLLYLALSRQQRLQQAAMAESALQLALKDAQLQRLLGQLSPHFTFNTLNNIRALILKDAEAARSLLARFAALLRYQLVASDAALISVTEEMNVVRDYLELVRLQLGSRLHYAERIAPATQGLQVPRFSLQLLVENAIKHGLGLSPSPGRIEVDIDQQGPVLQMDVRNTGTLGDRGLSRGIGLKNLEQRLQLDFGAAASLTLQQEGEFVLARIRIEHAA